MRTACGHQAIMTVGGFANEGRLGRQVETANVLAVKPAIDGIFSQEEAN